MVFTCEYCDRKFPTNASLYVHKQTQHGTPKLVLVNHDKGKDDISNNDNGMNNKKKRKHRVDDSKPPDKKRKDSFQIIDEYNDGDDDVQDNFEIIDEYINDDGQDDENFKIIDRFSDDGQDDHNLDVVDELSDDGQDENNLKIVDRYDDPSIRNRKPNYKQLYENCARGSRKLRDRIKKIRTRNNKRLGELQKAIKQQKVYYEKQINTLKNRCEAEINNTRQECDEKIQNLKREYNDRYEQLERECEEKIKNLSNHIKSLQEDDEDIDGLSKAIFNCTSMQEIFEILNLVKNHQYDQVVQKHLKTIQNLFLSLSFGVLPICQPQREKITDEQKDLVERIQSMSPNRAKVLLKEHRNKITKLFTIIEDSLKLARNSYNKYGIDRDGI